MLSTIERDIYVIDKCYAKPIYYKQGTNAISLKFNFKDYTIPTGSVAKAYVNKPSGKATYLTATITEDNAVIVKPKTQMFSEDGKSGLHIKITKNEDVLMSFEYTINVEKNPIAGEVPPSENESDMMDSMLELLKIEVNKATLQATQTVQAEGAKQVQAVQTAAQEIIADREQIQKNKTDIASLTQNTADAIINTASGEHIVVGDSSGHLLDNLKIYGKSVQNGTPTLDNPVPIVSTGDNGKIETSISTKNLFDKDGFYNFFYEKTKDIFKETVDGRECLKWRGATGYNSSNNTPYLFPFFIKKGNKVTISYYGKRHSTSDVEETGIVIRKASGNSLCSLYCKNTITWEKHVKSFVLDTDAEYLSIAYANNGYCYFSDIQIEINDTDTEYIPYTKQSLSVPTPNGLPGILVKSGGNYTDQNGQQWICDEIDLKRGKYVKRVGKIIFDGDEHWWKASKQTYQIFGTNVKDNKGLPGLCNRFTIRIVQGLELGCETQTNGIIYLTTGHETIEELKAWLNTNPVTVLYVLNTSTETDIPQETLIAYKKLHSNYLSTVVQNDSGAGMELSYVADTKNYTDNKIKEAVSAQMQNLANLLSLMPLSTQAAMIEADTNNILDNMEVTEHE